MSPEEQKAADEKAAAEKAAAEKAAAANAGKAATSDRPKRGDLVVFRHPDQLTGQVLEGAAVVSESSDEGGIWLAPLAVHHLFVDPENVSAVAADDLED